MTTRTIWVVFWGALALLSGGCGGVAAPDSRTFDLGLDAPGSRIAGVRVGFVRAVAPFESTDMQYRLAYRNAAEIAAFANSRWAATPAEMLRKQLLRAAGDGASTCILAIEIQEFSQVFGAKDTSDARVEVRAGLTYGSRSLARQFAVVEGNSGPDAVSGAAAFARAVNRVIGELGGWVASQPECR